MTSLWRHHLVTSRWRHHRVDVKSLSLMTGVLQPNCLSAIEFMSIRRTFVIRVRKNPLAYSICECYRLGCVLEWRPYDSIKMFRAVIHIKDASLPKDVSISRLYMVTRRVPVFRKRIKFLADPFFEISTWILTQLLMGLSSTITPSGIILHTGYLVLDFFTQLCTCRNRSSWKISTCNYQQSIRIE